MFSIFGFYSSLKVNYTKTFATVKKPKGQPQPASVAGITVKPWVKYLGVLLGNVSGQQAYGPAIAKMMGRAKALSTLPLGMEEKAHLLATWITLVSYLTARAHEPTHKVVTAKRDTASGVGVEFLAPHSRDPKHAQKGRGIGACAAGTL